MREVSAAATTRGGTVRVRATENGVPIAVEIDPSELRYGGEELARTIVDLCTRAAASAKAERRSLLERDGMDGDVLDRLGLPRASDIARAENDLLGAEDATVTWMKTV